MSVPSECGLEGSHCSPQQSFENLDLYVSLAQTCLLVERMASCFSDHHRFLSHLNRPPGLALYRGLPSSDKTFFHKK